MLASISLLYMAPKPSRLTAHPAPGPPLKGCGGKGRTIYTNARGCKSGTRISSDRLGKIVLKHLNYCTLQQIRPPNLFSESGQDGAEAPKPLHLSANLYDRLYHMWATNGPECSRGCNFTAILIRTASNRSRCPKIGPPDIRKLVKGFFGTMRGAGGTAIQVARFSIRRPRL